jgi:hypothetical protein
MIYIVVIFNIIIIGSLLVINYLKKSISYRKLEIRN